MLYNGTWSDMVDKKRPISITLTGVTLYVNLTFDPLGDVHKVSPQPSCCLTINVILLKKDCFLFSRSGLLHRRSAALKCSLKSEVFGLDLATLSAFHFYLFVWARHYNWPSSYISDMSLSLHRDWDKSSLLLPVKNLPHMKCLSASFILKVWSLDSADRYVQHWLCLESEECHSVKLSWTLTKLSYLMNRVWEHVEDLACYLRVQLFGQSMMLLLHTWWNFQTHIQYVFGGPSSERAHRGRQ